MNKAIKKRLVPKLRFPEFRDDGEWEEKKLGDLSQIVRGGSPRPIDDYITVDKNGLNWLKIADVDKESKYVTSTKEKVIPSALSKTREVNPGDLIMSNSMSFGRPYILKIKSCIHDGWIAVTQINDKASRDYLYYLILSPASQEYFMDNAAGSGVQNLNADIIKLLQVPIPEYSEQQKIADCLSSIDELITAQSQKVEALKTHKKGLMQQLFPREGETVPRLRFSEFLDAGEWEEKTLRDISDLITKGTTPQIFSENGIRFIKIESFYESHIALERCAFIDEEIHNNELKRSRLKINDILFAIAGATIGKVNLVTENLLPANTNQALAIIRLNEKENVNLILCILKSEIMKKYIKKSISVGAQPNLNLEQIGSFCFKYPCDPKEQQKIASCLSSIDELITAQTQKLATLKNHKKGLMQQLFPATDEVNI